MGALVVVETKVASRSRTSPVSLGTRLRANDGRQHSSRIVRWTRSTAPLVAGRPARMKVCVAPSSRTASPNTWERNSEPLNVGQDPLEAPAVGREVGRDPPGEGRGLRRRRVERCGRELGPDVRAREVDGRVLPDPPGGARESAHVEAVEADELARVVDLDVPWRLRRPTLGFGRGGIARDERQAGQPPGQAVPAQDPPHPVGGDDDAAPALRGEGGADPPGAEPGVTQGEREHALLGEQARLVGHPGRSALPRAEHLEPERSICSRQR